MAKPSYDAAWNKPTVGLIVFTCPKCEKDTIALGISTLCCAACEHHHALVALKSLKQWLGRPWVRDATANERIAWNHNQKALSYEVLSRFHRAAARRILE